LHRTQTGIQSRSRTSATERVLERAAAWGIDTEYQDGFGRRRKVKLQIVSRLLAAVAGDRQHSVRLLPRSIVVRGQTARHVDVAAPDGTALRWEIFSDRVMATGKANAPCLMLPQDLPIGLLRLRIETVHGRMSEESTLIVCPRRAYQGDDSAPRRMWGLAVQLYGLRSARNWGHGDFTDLLSLIDLAADLGASTVGLNPLHALFDDRPSEPSPYFPNSRLFLNPLYIDLDAVPEFPGAEPAGLAATIARLRTTEMVEYPAVAEAKLRALRMAYDHFCSHGTRERLDAFASFRQARGAELAKFACFEVLRRKFAAPWWEWPSPWQQPDAAALDEFRRTDESDIGYVEFVQWLAHEQLDRCRAYARERGLPVGLYLDVAVGVRRDGFDAWCDQDAIVQDMTIGAPPDLLNRSGQDWGLAAFNPVALEDRSFAPYRRMLQASMRYAGAIRLDHVLGLKRLFLVPAGRSPEDGLYIRGPFEALLAVTVLESIAAKCIVIGEDLGTVPDGFRETMMDWGLWSYQVMMFERSQQGEFCPAKSYRENALVAFATHDLPTFRGWWDASDLAARRNLGLKLGETLKQRRAARDALRRAVAVSASEQTTFAEVARFLAGTTSRLLMVSIEDLLGVLDQVNVPGTIDEHPNWRRRWPLGLEEVPLQEGVASVAEIMRSAGRDSGTAGMPG
jgi:4-alpha-glucanotransferase